MTFAPQSLKDLGAYIVSQGCVNLGVVGDTAHTAKGVSYHLGADQLTATAYSRIHPRDKAGLSNAASAIDIGKVKGTLKNLQTLSNWLQGQLAARAIDTLDIRELIYSPDGLKVMHWDSPTQTLYTGGTGTGHGDNSHLTHTHVSFFRDSEARPKTSLFARYFEGEDLDAKVDIPVGRVNVAAGGTVYADPEKSAVLIPVWSGAQNVQAYSQRAGTPGLTAIRIDLIGSGGDDLRIGWVGTDKVSLPAPPVTDCAPQVAAANLAGQRAEWDRQNLNAKVALAPKP